MKKIAETNINNSSKNYSIELLRFLFAIFIILYHYYSFILKGSASPLFFMHAYMGDEFFFMVSGFFLANSITKKIQSPDKKTSGYIISRIKGIAIPYYISWVLCFIGLHISINYKETLHDLLNSIYELLFLGMAGFKNGYYSNDPTWYVSAFFIIILIFAPIAEKFKDNYFRRTAPIVSLLCYGIIALNTNTLYAPHTIMFNFIYKGIIRCAAGIHAGFYIYSLYTNPTFKSQINEKRSTTVFIAALSFLIVLLYMIIPTKKFDDAMDYAVVLFLFLFLTVVFCFSSKIEQFLKRIPFILKLGRFSVYLYFSQAIVYTQKQLLHDWNISNYKKLIVWIALCFLAAIVVMLIGKIFTIIIAKFKKEVVNG